MNEAPKFLPFHRDLDFLRDPGSGSGDSQWSVTSVLFQGDNYLISSGAKDGTIKVWDLRQLYQTSGFVLRGKVDPTPAHVLSYAGLYCISPNKYSYIILLH